MLNDQMNQIFCVEPLLKVARVISFSSQHKMQTQKQGEQRDFIYLGKSTGGSLWFSPLEVWGRSFSSVHTKVVQQSAKKTQRGEADIAFPIHPRFR